MCQDFDVIRKFQAAVRKANLRIMLSAEVEIFAFQAKLPQQFRQRPRANAWLYIVGKGVESDVKLPTVERVIGIEPAESVVFLYD